MIKFGPWAPDAYDLNSGLAGEAQGVLPKANSYGPWPSMQAFSAALGSACKGAFLARTSSGNYVMYAGTTTKLYKFASATSWTDVSGAAYNVPTDEFWSWTQYGSLLFATNGTDGVQSIDVDIGAAFAAATGSPPAGRIIRTVGDFVMVGRTTGYPTGVEWSALDDSTFWTHALRSSDFQLFPDGGYVSGITPLDAAQGIIFQETAIRRYVTTTDGTIFNFSKVEDGQGCIAQNSCVTVNGTSYYFGRNGFRKMGLSTGFVSLPIGLDVIDKWFQDSINTQRLYLISGVADPLRARIFFLAPAVGNASSAIQDICLCYDITHDQWTHAPISASILIGAATPGYTLEDLDTLYGTNLDVNVPITLDSPSLAGGVPNVAGFDASFKLAFFNGPNQAATVQTNEFQPIPDKRTFVRGYRPITDAINVTGRIATRESPVDMATWTGSNSVDDQGLIQLRASGLLIRAEATIAAGETWTHLQGVDWRANDMIADGRR